MITRLCILMLVMKTANTGNLKPPLYLIHIKEKLSPQMAEWFEDAKIITMDQGETMITCSIIDQAALHGVLSKIRDLNLTLISLAMVELPENVKNTPTYPACHGDYQRA